MSKYSHIRLSRAFRPVVLAAIKADPGWPAYMTQHGLDGRSEGMDKPEIHACCEALGIDLQGMFDAFNGATVPARAAQIVTAMGVNTDPNMLGGASSREIALALANEDEDERIEEAHMTTSEALEGRDIEDVISEALAPVAVHMTPHLASMMPSVLRPLVEAAVRGPRVVTQTVTVDASGAAVAAITPVFVPPVTRVVKTVPLYQAFGLRKSDAKEHDRYALENVNVNVCDHVDPLNPIDPDYVWQCEMLVDLAVQDTAGLNGWVFGPAGVGKTLGIAQYAARLGRPYFRIAIERTTEFPDLIGQEVPARGGGVVWQDGKLTRAFRVPNAVILLDEPTLLRSGTLAMLQTALDHRALFLSTGETVKAAPGVFIVAADNTAGCGDDTGRYVDTSPVNAAFLDRFALKTAVSWLTVGQETNMVASRARISPVAAKIMVEYASSTRTQADAGQITMGVTPRRLVAWALAVKGGKGSARAWHSVIVTGAAPEDREKLIALEATDLRGKHKRIDDIVRGLIDPLAPVADPNAGKPQGGVGPNALQFPDDDPTA